MEREKFTFDIIHMHDGIAETLDVALTHGAVREYYDTADEANECGELALIDLRYSDERFADLDLRVYVREVESA